MGFIIQSRCSQCDYQIDSLSVGNNDMLAICSTCKSLANPKAILFRYDLPPCDECGAILSRGDFMDSGAVRSGPNWTPSELTCPRCKSGILEFMEKIHFSMEVVDRCPELHAEVHGCYERPMQIPTCYKTKEELERPADYLDFGVPGLWLREGKIEVLDVPARECDRAMVLRVVGLERNGESVKKLTLRFERWLT